MTEALQHDYLNKPDWTRVRSVYKKLSQELHLLTDSYAVKIDHRQKLMLDHLILGIDVVDKSVDELETQSARNDLTQSIAGFLKNEDLTWIHELASELLQEKMVILKRIVKERDIEFRFLAAVQNIFKYTEEKRHSLTIDELITLVKLEGEATAVLPLSIMGIDKKHAFAGFFKSLCMLMGLADLIVDARSDYRSNYISLKPTLGLYLRLNAILIKEGLSLIFRFPRKLRFLSYCIRFSLALLLAKD